MHIMSNVSLGAIVLAAGLCLAAAYQPAAGDDRSPVSQGLSAVESYSYMGQVPASAVVPLSPDRMRRIAAAGSATAGIFDNHVTFANDSSNGMIEANAEGVIVSVFFKILENPRSP